MKKSNGNVLRIQRSENYKTISCIALDDKELSFKAKGIHAYLITRPDNWHFSMSQVYSMGKEGEISFEKAVKELKNRGYLKLTRYKVDSDGTFVWEWHISETPNVHTPENHPMETHGVDLHPMETHPLVTDPIKHVVGNIEYITNSIKQETTNNTTMLNDEVREIFEFWQTELGHQDKRYTPGRKEKIKARLSDGFTIEQLKNVIRYVKTNSFLRGQNPRNKAYDDFENIFRKTERVEAYLAQYAKETKNPRIISTEEDRKKVQGKWLREN